MKECATKSLSKNSVIESFSCFFVFFVFLFLKYRSLSRTDQERAHVFRIQKAQTQSNASQNSSQNGLGKPLQVASSKLFVDVMSSPKHGQPKNGLSLPGPYIFVKTISVAKQRVGLFSGQSTWFSLAIFGRPNLQIIGPYLIDFVARSSLNLFPLICTGSGGKPSGCAPSSGSARARTSRCCGPLASGPWRSLMWWHLGLDELRTSTLGG